MDLIVKYFPSLTPVQQSQLGRLETLYAAWNSKINVISRKDMEHFYERHVLHSLSIAKAIRFSPGTKILDIGTGGGFPGIPLAIVFPHCHFHLVDSIGKKMKVVESVAEELKLDNVSCEKNRAENLESRWDFVVSRAVTSLPVFTAWAQKLISVKQFNTMRNGILYLKGGDFADELKSVKLKSNLYPISEIFEEPFFETKTIVHLYR